MSVDPEPTKSSKRDMNINLDRQRRVRSGILYWLLLLGVGCLLAYLLMQFTGSKLVAFGLAGGMLLYMLIASALASKSLSQTPGDGRLN